MHVHAAQMFDVVFACSESLTLVIEEQPRRVALVADMQATIEDGYVIVTTRDDLRDEHLITLRKRVTITDDGERMHS
jgi:hypothetical protein